MNRLHLRVENMYLLRLSPAVLISCSSRINDLNLSFNAFERSIGPAEIEPDAAICWCHFLKDRRPPRILEFLELSESRFWSKRNPQGRSFICRSFLQNKGK